MRDRSLALAFFLLYLLKGADFLLLLFPLLISRAGLSSSSSSSSRLKLLAPLGLRE
uniref:Taxi B n=1 Tax=Husseyella diffidens TaxID=2294081 RepID=A0A4Q8KK34_9HEMI|nr:taxi B [Husseyella diffidens]